MRNNLGWLLYWRWREIELNPHVHIRIKLTAEKNCEWAFEVNTNGTTLENILAFRLDFFKNWDGFIHCEAKKDKVIGKSSCSRVIEMIQVFRECAEHYSDLNHVVDKLTIFDESFFNFISWHNRCFYQNNGQADCITIETLDALNWRVRVDLQNTNLQYKPFDRIERRKSDFDWFFCDVQDSIFYAESGPFNLIDVFEMFNRYSKVEG